MNEAELEGLLEQVTQGNWSVDGSYVTSDAIHEMDCVAESHRYDGEYDLQLMALAPSLARRVIAAEKLVEALKCIPLGDGEIGRRVAAYEATK